VRLHVDAASTAACARLDFENGGRDVGRELRVPRLAHEQRAVEPDALEELGRVQAAVAEDGVHRGLYELEQH
jgi:hypothetical protein